ncbi:MAG: hypothetical protein QF486_05370 [Candidatus Woesearchaeota archaeon]|jgi:hypothetical protein|nr:hypothetical protein [Candidatus Woesearchaeota archaeon]MDP7181842.1 hypothetical protein [Candidatus Woesearchaeota archaeon]MDP7199018.1 hypothetical protein [Candidatus Woesearchaeota archaeon]MDP7467728.1 hypothetical protein [Candidatus Woesearchaeota archaeon]MDP7646812.1 hypothetical protein [Candidatus Woesearchaeota archaeon]|tara:strand:- start:275 stop:469 length:195 start_codon:yes stop_codon:yes gene_type:complete
MIPIEGKVKTALGGEKLRLTVEGKRGAVITLELNKAAQENMADGEDRKELARVLKDHGIVISLN